MKRLCSIITLLVSFLLLTGKIQARITMPSLFSDGMVLQQQNLVAIGAVVIEKTENNCKTFVE